MLTMRWSAIVCSSSALLILGMSGCRCAPQRCAAVCTNSQYAMACPTTGCVPNRVYDPAVLPTPAAPSPVTPSPVDHEPVDTPPMPATPAPAPAPATSADAGPAFEPAPEPIPPTTSNLNDVDWMPISEENNTEESATPELLEDSLKTSGRQGQALPLWTDRKPNGARRLKPRVSQLTGRGS